MSKVFIHCRILYGLEFRLAQNSFLLLFVIYLDAELFQKVKCSLIIINSFS